MHVFATDRIRFVLHLDVGHLPQRDLAGFGRIQCRRINENLADGIHRVARITLQAQGQVEAAAALQHARHRLAIQCRLDVIVDLADIDAVARRLVSVNGDGHLRDADLLFQVDIHGAGYGLHDGLRLQPELVQDRQFFAVNLDRHLRAHT